MELLVNLFSGALGANFARPLRYDGLGFLLASALGTIGGGLAGLGLTQSGLGGLSHAAAIDGYGIDPVALGVQVAVTGAAGAALALLSGFLGRRRGG